jgi:Flp pilus assembly protein TadG
MRVSSRATLRYGTEILSVVSRRWLVSTEGAQLVEFALAVPFLLAMIVGILDFGGAYNLKQKLNNATREGARYAVNQSSNISDINTTSVSAIGTVVSNYLTNSGVTKCAIGNASGGPLNYTFSSTSTGCGSFQLAVNRGATITSGSVTYLATKITITYPYSWSIGTLMKLFLPASTLNSALPSSLQTDTTMQNIN